MLFSSPSCSSALFIFVQLGDKCLNQDSPLMLLYTASLVSLPGYSHFCVCKLLGYCDPYPLAPSPPHLALSDVLYLKPGWIKMFFSPINKSITAPVSLSMLWISVQSQFPWEKKTAVYSEHGVCVWYPPVSTALITVSGDGSLLRSWDSATGALKWEVPTDLGTLENQQ